MKRSAFITIILATLLLTACGTHPVPQPSALTTPETLVTDAPGLSEATDASSGPENDFSDYMRVIAGGESIKPWEHFCYGALYRDGGMPVADGLSFSELMSEGAQELPVIEADGHITIEIAPGCDFRYAEIRFPDMRHAAMVQTAEELEDIINSAGWDMIFDAVICKQGEYVEQYDMNEHIANGYAFMLKVPREGLDGPIARVLELPDDIPYPIGSLSANELAHFAENEFYCRRSGDEIEQLTPWGALIQALPDGAYRLNSIGSHPLFSELAELAENGEKLSDLLKSEGVEAEITETAVLGQRHYPTMILAAAQSGNYFITVDEGLNPFETDPHSYRVYSAEELSSALPGMYEANDPAFPVTPSPAP